MTISESIRAKFRKARKARKLSQQDLADQLGVALRTLSSWERGEASPTWDDLDKWAAAVGIRR